MILPIRLEKDSYDVTLERGALARIGKIFDLDRKVLVVTDDGVPADYAAAVAEAAKEGYVLTLPQGETTKTLDSFAQIQTELLEKGFSRKDCVVAVGGGVVGDLAGFAAACYMRGIDFYNVPTTLLSQVDSSVGGKTAIDFGGIKNIVGAFHQPRGVVIDPDVLETLSSRQFACGAAEIIKMAATFDRDQFEKIEREGVAADVEGNIAAALQIKIRVVEEDEKETGVRRVLNFGHTLGHGIESVTDLLHGECVALGMLPMCSPDLRARLVPMLEREGLPVTCGADVVPIMEAVMHDKKAADGQVKAILCDKPGTYRVEAMTRENLQNAYEEVFG